MRTSARLTAVSSTGSGCDAMLVSAPRRSNYTYATIESQY
jgi:hypothetical protein